MLKNKTYTLIAFFVCTLALLVGANAVRSANTAAYQEVKNCNGKGQIIILADEGDYQTHAVYDFEAGTLTTVRVNKKIFFGGDITVLSKKNLR